LIVLVGTEVHITQEGIPEVIPVEACYLGWQESLSLAIGTTKPTRTMLRVGHTTYSFL
jgi:hypothetical protein